MTYQQHIFLCTLNCWPDDGLPVEEIADIAVSLCEGDPRGDVTYEEMEEALQYGFNNGWCHIAPEPTSGRSFVFPTTMGREKFKKGLTIF
jgi:hypothetical protein